MSGPGDDYDDMMDGPGVRGEAGGRAVAGDDEVTRFLTELRALGDGPAPEPSPELAALLGGATPILARRAAVRIVVRTVAVAAVVLGVLVLAAANHSLPSPAQRVVSDVVNVLTPFDITDPSTSPAPIPPRPSDKPHPTTSAPTSPRHSTTPPRTSHPPARGDDGGEDGSEGAGVGGGRDDGGRDDGGRDDGRSRSPSQDPGEDRSSSHERHSGGSDDDGHDSAPPSGSAPPSEGGDSSEPHDH